MISQTVIDQYPDIFKQISKYNFNNPTFDDVKEIIFHCCNVEKNYGFLFSLSCSYLVDAKFLVFTRYPKLFTLNSA